MSKKKIDWFKVFDKSVELLANDNTLTQLQLAVGCSVGYKNYKKNIKMKDVQNKVIEFRTLQEESKQEVFKQKAKESAERKYLSLSVFENIIDSNIGNNVRAGVPIEYDLALKLKLEILKEKGEIKPNQEGLEKLREFLIDVYIRGKEVDIAAIT